MSFAHPRVLFGEQEISGTSRLQAEGEKSGEVLVKKSVSTKLKNQKIMTIREKYTAFHIANYFLWRAWKEGIEITPLKLVKLVYIAYGWNLVLNDKRPKLFEEKIQAWKYGPVVPSIYHEFKEFGNSPIKKGNYATNFNSAPIVQSEDSDVLKILDAEWSHYKNKDGIDLSVITHEPDGAWDKAYNKNGVNSVLDDEDIQERAVKGISEYLGKIN